MLAILAIVIFRSEDDDNPTYDDEFRSRFRLTKEATAWLCNELRDDLVRRKSRTVILPEVQLLITLQFFASGGFQRNVGDHCQLKVAQSTVSRIMPSVVNSIIRRLGHTISFPRSREQQLDVSSRFFIISQMPGVVGAIDCTHIAIKAPPASKYNEESFINRKGFHSINVQVVCDSQLRILNINPLYPGRTHDAFIWRNSTLRENFEDGVIGRGLWLLGDSAYPLETWLLTPVGNPSTAAELNYNAAHRKARNTIERCFGVLKQRFRCLDLKSAGGLQYVPEKSAKIVMACAILHNICVAFNIPTEEICGNDDDDDDDSINEIEHSANQNAVNVRQQLILQRFC
ncbi:putative nuclease HARBI1 [Centruroides vittatus]|uniref:putative nuclease HARBI1 n=1 Tax=Centruroides vittatus TaxID=120091 RepID=UPI0035104CE7